MRWLMNLFRSINFYRLAGASALAGTILCQAPRAMSQDLEQRYRQAVELFKRTEKPDMQSACEQFQQIANESPNYKETQSYLTSACGETKHMLTTEEKWFKEGEDFFNQGRYDDARDKFQRAAKIPLKNPKYRREIARYLKDMDARQNEERLFQSGVASFKQGKYEEARGTFTQLAQGSGARVSDAQGYLSKIADIMSKKRATEIASKPISDAQKLIGEGRFAEARAILNPLVGKSGDAAGDARNLLSQMDDSERKLITEARSFARQRRDSEARDNLNRVVQGGGPQATEARALLAQLASQPAKPQPAGKGSKPSGSGSQTSNDEQVLRAGLQAYFEGKIDEAERDLSEYLGKKGPKQDLAYFFRGAAYSTGYFLSGEKDGHQKDLALADFRSLKAHAAQFQPPQQFVSPKILALYSEAMGALPR